MLALTDTDPGSWTIGGREVHTVSYGAVHVVHERRAAIPAMSDDELRAQHALVVSIAERAPAVLPARFGSLLSKRELTASVRRHENEILAALQHVHHHVQITVRVLGDRPRRYAAPVIAGMSGRQYLERARRAAIPPTTPAAERLLEAVRPLVTSERRERGAGRLLATIYHLVDMRHVDRYLTMAGRPIQGVIVSGPWPPFAFSPQLW